MRMHCLQDHLRLIEYLSTSPAQKRSTTLYEAIQYVQDNGLDMDLEEVFRIVEVAF